MSAVVSSSGDVINFADVIVDSDDDDGGIGSSEVVNCDVINDDDVTMCPCVIALVAVDDVALNAIEVFGAALLVFSAMIS